MSIKSQQNYLILLFLINTSQSISHTDVHTASQDGQFGLERNASFIYKGVELRPRRIKTLLHGQNQKKIGSVGRFFLGRNEHQKNISNP